MSYSVDLSIVIPARNEALRLPPTLRAIEAQINGQFGRVEVLVVDDGSEDDTVAVAQREGARILSCNGWCGAGAAVRRGMLAARGDRILMCDADGAVPFGELGRLAAALDQGYDVAVGSRGLRPETVEIPQPFHRIMMGRAWGMFVRRVLPTPVRDTQCGFKLFTRAAARTLFAHSRSTSFAFHVEVLRLADRLELRIAALPVLWRDQPGSKIRPVQDSTRMAIDLLRAAWRPVPIANMTVAAPVTMSPPAYTPAIEVARSSSVSM